MRKAAPLGLAMFAMLDGAAALAQPRNLGLASYKAPVVPTLVTDGSVVIAFTIRASGRVDDAVTLAATNQLLAASAREAVMEWRFDDDPVLGRGRDAKPNQVLRREIVELVFKRDGVVTSLSHFDSAKGWFPPEQRPLMRLVQSDESDPPLARLPVPPSDAATALARTLAAAGNIAVSYVIDETGKVRVPIVEWTDDVALNALALAVVNGWRYEPPRDADEPVLVEARVTLNLKPQAH